MDGRKVRSAPQRRKRAPQTGDCLEAARTRRYVELTAKMRQWPGAVGDKESGSGHGGIPKEGRGGGKEPGAKSQEPADKSQEPQGQRREPAPQSVRVQTKGLAEASGEKMKAT